MAVRFSCGYQMLENSAHNTDLCSSRERTSQVIGQGLLDYAEQVENYELAVLLRDGTHADVITATTESFLEAQTQIKMSSREDALSSPNSLEHLTSQVLKDLAGHEKFQAHFTSEFAKEHCRGCILERLGLQNNVDLENAAMPLVSVNVNGLLNTEFLEGLQILTKTTGRDWVKGFGQGARAGGPRVEQDEEAEDAYVGASGGGLEFFDIDMREGAITPVATQGAARRLQQILNRLIAKSLGSDEQKCSATGSVYGRTARFSTSGLFIPQELVTDIDFQTALQNDPGLHRFRKELTKREFIWNYCDYRNSIEGSSTLSSSEFKTGRQVSDDLSQLFGTYCSSPFNNTDDYKVYFHSAEHRQAFQNALQPIIDRAMDGEVPDCYHGWSNGNRRLALLIPAEIAENIEFRSLLRSNRDVSTLLARIVKADQEAASEQSKHDLAKFNEALDNSAKDAERERAYALEAETHLTRRVRRTVHQAFNMATGADFDMVPLSEPLAKGFTAEMINRPLWRANFLELLNGSKVLEKLSREYAGRVADLLPDNHILVRSEEALEKVVDILTERLQKTLSRYADYLDRKASKIAKEKRSFREITLAPKLDRLTGSYWYASRRYDTPYRVSFGDEISAELYLNNLNQIIRQSAGERAKLASYEVKEDGFVIHLPRKTARHPRFLKALEDRTVGKGLAVIYNEDRRIEKQLELQKSYEPVEQVDSKKQRTGRASKTVQNKNRTQARREVKKLLRDFFGDWAHSSFWKLNELSPEASGALKALKICWSKDEKNRQRVRENLAGLEHLPTKTPRINWGRKLASNELQQPEGVKPVSRMTDKRAAQLVNRMDLEEIDKLLRKFGKDECEYSPEDERLWIRAIDRVRREAVTDDDCCPGLHKILFRSTSEPIRRAAISALGSMEIEFEPESYEFCVAQTVSCFLVQNIIREEPNRIPDRSPIEKADTLRALRLHKKEAFMVIKMLMQADLPERERMLDRIAKIAH